MITRFLLGLAGIENAGRVTAVRDWHWRFSLPGGWWALALLVLLAILVAGLSAIRRSGLPLRLRILLPALRLLAFALLALILARTEVGVTFEQTENPSMAIITDQSGSMGLRDEPGGLTRLEAARRTADTLAARLDSQAFVARYDLDWRLSDDRRETATGSTRLMEGLAELLDREHDLQAVVLLSDGNDSTGDQGSGVAALYTDRGLPVYPVVFGRSEAPRIPRLRLTGGADYVRLGDDLRIEARFEAPDFVGQLVRARLFLGESDEPIVPPIRDLTVGEKPMTLGFTIKPESPGRKVYRLVVDGVRDADSEELLVLEHVVDVVPDGIRVLLVDIPRPERKMLGHWLQRDPVLETASLVLLPKDGWYAQGRMRHENRGTGLPDREADLYEYDVIILGDIPRGYFREGDPSETRMQWLAEFVKRRGGGLITLGGQQVYGAGNYDQSALAWLIPFAIPTLRDPHVKGSLLAIPTPLGLQHPVMRLEADAEANRNAWLDMPQLEGANRVGDVKPGAVLLAAHHTDEGAMPLVAAQHVGKGRVLSLAVDTTWRWQMLRPIGSDADGIPEGTDYYRRFWANAVRYVAPDPRLTPDRPQIARPPAQMDVGRTAVLTTRLVDRAWQPLRQADLTVRVTAPSGRVVRMHPADRRSRPGVYDYPVTFDEAGVWSVTAVVDEADALTAIARAEAALAAAKAEADAGAVAEAEKRLATARGRIAREEITVGGDHAEMDDPRARPDLMADLAAATGGSVFMADQVEALADRLELHARHRQHARIVAVWNLPLLLGLFVLIVAVDCYVRKRRGMA
jgi:uncharacterized membrane protein